MLLAEELVLLAYNDVTGKKDGFPNLGYALAGANLVDLAERGKIAIDGEGHKARLRILDTTDTGNRILDKSLAVLAGKYDGKRPSDALATVSNGVQEKVLDGLAERGILQKERGKVLGVFPSTRWPAVDSTHEDELRATLKNVLDGADPSARTAALIGLLEAVNAIGSVAGHTGRRAAKERAKEIAEREWAGDATQKAIQQMTAAVMVAATVATTTAATGT